MEEKGEVSNLRGPEQPQSEQRKAGTINRRGLLGRLALFFGGVALGGGVSGCAPEAKAEPSRGKIILSDEVFTRNVEQDSQPTEEERSIGRLHQEQVRKVFEEFIGRQVKQNNITSIKPLDTDDLRIYRFPQESKRITSRVTTVSAGEYSPSELIIQAASVFDQNGGSGIERVALQLYPEHAAEKLSYIKEITRRFARGENYDENVAKVVAGIMFNFSQEPKWEEVWDRGGIKLEALGTTPNSQSFKIEIDNNFREIRFTTQITR